MTRVEAIEKAERLRLLVAYANAWRTAHREYRVWRAAEWARRRARYRLHERAARRALIELLRTLAYHPDGRVRNDTADARRRLRAFRAASDRVFARLLQQGRKLFGVRRNEKPDPKTGLYSGSLDPALRAQVEARLRQLMRTAREGIDAA